MGKKVLISELFFLIIAICFCGCNKYETSESTVNTFFTYIRNANYAAADRRISGNSKSIESLFENELYGDYIEELVQSIDYTVISSCYDSETDEICFVTIEVNYPNASKVFTNTVLDFAAINIAKYFLSEDEEYESFEQCFKENCVDSNIKTGTKRITVKVIENSDGWKIVYDKNIEEIVSCGLSSIEKNTIEVINKYSNLN